MGIGIQRKRLGPAVGIPTPWSGSGGGYTPQTHCPRLEGLVPGSETEVIINENDLVSLKRQHSICLGGHLKGKKADRGS